MFTKGEAVVYPMHGAGVIENFEEKNIDGINKNYYVLSLPLGNLTVMLAEECIQNTGLRKVLSKSDINRIIKNVSTTPVCTRTANWSQRYKENMERMKTGKLCESAAVFYELFQKEKAKGLSGAEKKVMTTAKKIVVSEIMLGLDIEKCAAEDMLEKYL